MIIMNIINRWERINVIAADDNNGGNAIEELRKAVERMPKEFQEYISVNIYFNNKLFSSPIDWKRNSISRESYSSSGRKLSRAN